MRKYRELRMDDKKIKINKYQTAAMMAVILWGFVSHGYMFANKLGYHDDSSSYFGVGVTYQSGRWFLGILQGIIHKIGLSNYSMPWWNGIVTLLLLAVAAAILAELFEIRHYAGAILMGMLLVSFPVMASLFAYMFTAPYYMLAILMETAGVYITVKVKYGGAAGVILIGLALGIYQVYFGLATALFVLVLICSVENHDFVHNIRRAVYYLLVLIAGLLIYFIGNKACLNILQLSLLDYQGISGMMNITPEELLKSAKHAYHMFLIPLTEDVCGIANDSFSRFCYRIIYLVTAVILLIRLLKRSAGWWNRLLLLVLYAMVPVSITIIYVMAGTESTVVHTLMIYPYVIGFLYPVVLLEKEKKENLWVKAIAVIYCATAFLLSGYYARLDNAAYLKADHQQESAITYYTNVISAIKNAEGYRSDLPVLFYGTAGQGDESIANLYQYMDITLQGYGVNEQDFISYYANENFLKIYCGYTYTDPVNREQILGNEEFVNMPTYPEDGSVKVIDGTVVVKFSEGDKK